MHIPDGFLDKRVAAVAGGLAIAGLAWALRKARDLPRRTVPLMGVTAAVIFAAQMVNFPVTAGTSGHLVGAVLAAVLVGPAAGVVVITSILIVQCLAFQDGGLWAMGANVLNMAVIGALGGWLIYDAVYRVRPSPRWRIVAAAFAAWCSTVLASGACAVQLALTGWGKLSVLVPAMVGIHMLIGLGEAIITAMVLAGIWQTRPALLEDPCASPRATVGWSTIGAGLVVAFAVALLLSPLASGLPDGLDSTAEARGFAEHAAPANTAPMPEYQIPGMEGGLSTALAGGVGTIVAFGLALALARVLLPRRKLGAAEAMT